MAATTTVTATKDHLPLHHASSSAPPHASVPSLDALALLGLLALSGFLSTELLDRASRSPLANTTIPHPITGHLHPFFSVLAPMTETPGGSVTFYVLPDWVRVGVMVPGLDALTVHALTDLSPIAAETGEWLQQLLQTSQQLAWSLSFLALCAMTLGGAQKWMLKTMSNSRSRAVLLISSCAMAGQASVGLSALCLGLLFPFVALYRLPLLLAADLAVNPTAHPLLKGLSPQEAVFRFVHWEEPDSIDDPGLVTIFRAETAVVLVAALGLIWIGIGSKVLLPLLLPAHDLPHGKRSRDSFPRYK